MTNDKDINKYVITDRGLFRRTDIEVKKAMHIADRYIYGAIWTDKGLIYVAKMNEESVLCLI